MERFRTENSSEIKALMETMINPNTELEVVEEAALSLGDFNDDRKLVNSFLIKQLGKCNPSIKGSIIYSLGKLKSKEAIPTLKNLLKDSDEDIRWVTVEAIEKISVEETGPELIQCLEQESIPEIKAAIIRTLSNFNTEQILLTLYRYASCDSDTFVRESAIKALEKIAERSKLEKLNESGNIDFDSNLTCSETSDEIHKDSENHQDGDIDIDTSWKFYSFRKMLEENYHIDRCEGDIEEIEKESFESIRRSKATLIDIISGIYENSSSTEKEFIELANLENPTKDDINKMKSLMYYVDSRKLFYFSLKIADINSNHPLASKKERINIDWKNHKLLLHIYCFDNIVSGEFNVLFRLTTLFREEFLSPDFDISITNQGTPTKGKRISKPYPKRELIFSFDKSDTFDLEITCKNQSIEKIKFTYN